MSKWSRQPIRSLIDAHWPGEWGMDPSHNEPGVVVFRSTDIDDNGHLLEEEGGVYRSLPMAKINAKKLLRGDILLEASGGAPDRPVGRVALFEGKRDGVALCANFLRTLRPNRSVSSDYLRWALFFLQQQSEIWRYQQQTTGIINLKVADYLTHEIGTPPFEQQLRIAEILSTTDEAIGQTDALIAKYQEIKAGLMHDLFTRGVTPDGHLRPPRGQAPHLYKQSPLGWIPVEWELAKLRDKSYPGRPHIKTGPFGSSLKGEHWVEHGHPVITIGALGEGELLPEGLLFVSAATAQRLRAYQLEPGDVVFSRVADVGRSTVICKQHDGWIMSSNLMRISLDRNLVAPSYLQSQFAFDFKVKSQIRTKVNSGGRDVANGQVLNQLLFAWPRRDEQANAMERITTIDAHRRGLAAQRAKLVELKQGLMHDLLTGQVRVKLE